MSTHSLTPGAACPAAAGFGGAKRAIDMLGATLGLILLAPLLLTVAVAIIASSRATPLFRQRRVGVGGREFVMWKFRTMVADAERLRSQLIALSRESEWLHLDHDPRVTRLGRLLRRTSLDELPQLFNVVLGDMSLVGPRPLPISEHAQLPAWASPRVFVRPGLTGLWQVRGRTRTGFLEMLELDCEYARQRSLWLDFKVLVRTVPAVLIGRGAN